MASPFLSKRGVVSAVMEGNGYGCQPAVGPTVSSHDILTSEPAWSMVHEPNARSGYRPTLSPLREIEGAKTWSVDLTTELKTSGAAAGDGAGGNGTAWEGGHLLRACGYSFTSHDETGAGNEDGYDSYVPLSYAQESIALTDHLGGATATSSIKYTLRGGVGNVSFELPAGGIPMASFSFQGKYTAPEDNTTVDWTAASYQTSLPVKVQSILATVDGYQTGVIRNLNIDTGNVISKLANVNGPYFAGGVNLTFADADPDTITRASGSWITDGVVPGMRFTVAESASNDGSYTVATVSALVITCITGDALAAEGPTGSITLNFWDSEGTYGFCITDRLPTFSLTMEQVLATTKDMWQLPDEGDTLALSAIIGNGTGGGTPDTHNRIYFGLPYATIDDIAPGSDNGVAVWNITGRLYSVDGDNEILIVQGAGTTA